MLSALTLSILAIYGAPGDWTEPRQNAHLTAHQPLAGNIVDPPSAHVVLDLGRSRPSLTQTTMANGEPIGLALVHGAMMAFDVEGELLWKSHPPGLNFTTIHAIRDLDGDGSLEVLLQAGRSAMPYGAAVLLSLSTGDVLWRYDVEPMSYAWYLHVGHYIAGRDDEQIVVLMHAYPPDLENGYITLFAYDDDSEAPAQQWRYDFHEFTCFPSFLQSDLDGDGAKELVVETHSRMWFLDAASGEMKHFAKWDVAPANIRSYGLVKFLDIDGDHDEDFLCIANFAQHHEVLLNEGGTYEKAWHHGWPESVTTGKVATRWPEPPHSDLDRDGGLEIAVSMFNSEEKEQWLLRVYNAVTGELRYRYPGVIATAIADIDDDGLPEILGNRSSDPTGNVLDGAVILRAIGNNLERVWEDSEARAMDGVFAVMKANARYDLSITEDAVALVAHVAGAPATPPVDFTAVPEVVGPGMSELLSADVRGDSKREVIRYSGDRVAVYTYEGNLLKEDVQYTSTALPAIADMNGDSQQEIITAVVRATELPTVAVHQGDEIFWQKALPTADRSGLPQPRTAYLRTGDFTGDGTPDVYLWAGTPMVRSVVLDGRDGSVVWERGEFPDISRYWGPSVNEAAVYDFNKDGADDLVFTNPDYYCIANGRTGDMLIGPTHPPQIFDQPSQGLYTLPAVLEVGNAAWVALVSGHYFQGAMTIDAKPLWHSLPTAGEARSGSEAFLPRGDEGWSMGFGRQNGKFACVDVATGTLQWEYDLEASATNPISCDIDGDGTIEFIVGDSHGWLRAMSGVEAPELRWSLFLGAAVGNPIAADITGNGHSDLLVPTADGRIHLLSGSRTTNP